MDVGHERDVDLDGLQGDLPQAEQRGVAGAEIVEPEVNTRAAQSLCHRLRDGDLAEQGILGDLQYQTIRAKAMSLQDRGDAARSVISPGGTFTPT